MPSARRKPLTPKGRSVAGPLAARLPWDLRDTRREGSLTSLANDARYSLRMLRRTPGFTAVAVTLLALGIGVNTLLFTAVRALVSHPLPVRDPDGLVDVFTTDAAVTAPWADFFPISQPNFEDFERESRGVLTGLAGYVPAAFTVSGREGPERIKGYLVTANYFDVLGVLPSLGRAFSAGEDRIGAGAAVAVVSHELWSRRFGGDPAAVGRSLLLDGVPYTIVGVAPPGFRGTVTLVSPEQIFVPLSSYERTLRGTARTFFRHRRGLFLRAFGRLRPGVTAEAAAAALATVARRLEAEYPDANRGRGIAIRPLAESAVGTDSVRAVGESRRARHGSAALIGVAAAVLLIAAANLSSLLMLRFARRSRETSIRAALGADPRRLFTQPLVEAGLLCGAGGVAGWALAAEARGLLQRFAPPFVPAGILDVRPDWSAFAFALAVAAGVSLLVAALPALRASSVSPAAALAAGGRTGTAAGPQQRRATRCIVAGEIALAALALVGSGLFLRALGRARAVDPGIRTTGLSYFSLDLAAAGYEGSRAQVLCREIARAVRALPGATAAGVATLPPIGGGPLRTVLREGFPDDPSRIPPAVTVYGVSPGHLAAEGIGIVRGRDVAAEDREDTAPIAVVNEAFAARHWPGENPIGRRFRMFGGPSAIEVVGVARNTLVARLDEPLQPVAYLPLSQSPLEVVTVAASTAGDSAVLLAAAERRVREIDASLVPFDGSTVEAALAFGLWAPRAMASLLLLFGALALALAGIGLYALVAQSVVERTREIGIRVALGATPGSIRGLVLRDGAVLVGTGAPIGLAAAALLSRSLGGVLYGLGPLDPTTFAGVPALLAAATVAACLVPAARAIALDPITALRAD